MNRQGFNDTSPGILIPTIGGRKAFVPHPLPPSSLDLAQLASPLAEASAAVGELNGIGRTVPNPYLLIRPLQRREAVSSSAMEGTYTTLSELLFLEAGVQRREPTSDTREVANYTRALADALRSLADLPISERLLRDSQSRLLTGVTRLRGALARPGEFKRDQNWIGGGRDINQARFIPPPREPAIDGLAELMKYLHREDRRRTPALIDAALIHYQFEALHPFDDGNGRIGRMLIPLMLIERGTLAQPLLYLSPVLERSRDEYIDLLFNVSRKGDWDSWVTFFLSSVAEAAKDATEISDRILNLQRDYRARLQTARSSALLLRIVDLAFEQPVRLVSALARDLGITYPSASHNVRQLVAAGIAQRVPGAYPKTIIFPGVLRALESDAT